MIQLEKYRDEIPIVDLAILTKADTKQCSPKPLPRSAFISIVRVEILNLSNSGQIPGFRLCIFEIKIFTYFCSWIFRFRVEGRRSARWQCSPTPVPRSKIYNDLTQKQPLWWARNRFRAHQSGVPLDNRFGEHQSGTKTSALVTTKCSPKRLPRSNTGISSMYFVVIFYIFL